MQLAIAGFEMRILYIAILKRILTAREMAQLLRALATLPENWGSTASTHIVAYNRNSSSRTSDTKAKHPVMKEFLAKCSEA